MAQFPFGTAIQEDGTTFVTETKYHRIRVFGADGETRAVFGSRGTGAGCFESPRGLCIVGRDMVAVADSGNARVQLLRAETGQPVRYVSGGQLYRPWDVAWVPEIERVFVADLAKNCVKVFTLKGEVVGTVELDNVGEPLFDKPCRVEYHPLTGNIHIADRQSARVHAICPKRFIHLATRELRPGATPW
mmetsp:Transcript_12305/g.39366  ORF Transcript_12305/g.39366 Transcript_12305/m.39366 type:complete len:189 (+) Transcript_12305:94-660(+)